MIIEAAWVAAGRPEPNWQGKAKAERTRPSSRIGVCALTGRRGLVFDARHCVSESFTSWDRLRYRDRDPAGVAFGQAAAWAFRLRVAMQQPHVFIDGRFAQVDPASLHDALVALRPTNHPVHGFVCIPVSRQKHLLPWVERGTVRTDDETLAWKGADVDRLDVYGQLRTLGFGEAALLEVEPRWPILSKLNHEARSTVLRRWHDLDGWRAHPTYMDVAARATRPVKEAAA